MNRMIPKTNLCFFNTTRFWGGGEKWHFDAALYMVSRGHTVFFVVYPDGALDRKLKEQSKIRAVPVSVSNLSFLNPLKLIRLIRLFRDEKIQTVVFNGSADVKAGAISATLAGVPAVVYRRGLAVPVKNSFFNRFLYGRLVTHFLTNSRETANELFRDLKPPETSSGLRTIYNGIDLSKFNLASARADRSAEASPLVVGTAGRLEIQKGHHYLIEAARILKEKNLDFTVRIAGDGKQRPEIEKSIQQWGLTDHFELLGFVTDMEKFMEELDIFAFPSIWEGFGYAAVEAMAAARPVVAFDVSSNREIIEDEWTGFLVPENDITGFADKILELAKNPALLEKMGRNGQVFVAEHFDQRKQLDELENYLCKEVFIS